MYRDIRTIEQKYENKELLSKEEFECLYHNDSKVQSKYTTVAKRIREATGRGIMPSSENWAYGATPIGKAHFKVVDAVRPDYEKMLTAAYKKYKKDFDK